MGPFGAQVLGEAFDIGYDQYTIHQAQQHEIELMGLAQQNEMELMGLGYGLQQGLNMQGHDLQMDLWNKTNYGAQMEHMRKAGLNPALMYGKGAGQGGTTGSQTGGQAPTGSAKMGHAPRSNKAPMELAQAKLMEAQAKDLESQTNKRDGIDTDLAKAQKLNLDEQKLKIIQETTNLKSEEKILQFKQGLMEAERDRAKNGFIKGDTIGNLCMAMGLDPKHSEWDRMQIKTMVYSWFGAKVAGEVMRAVGKFGTPGGGGYMKNFRGFNQTGNTPGRWGRLGTGQSQIGSRSNGQFGEWIGLPNSNY